MISIPIPTEFPWFFPTNSPSPRPCSTLCAPWNSSKTVWIQRSFLPPRRWFLLFWWDDASNFHGFYDILLGFIWVLFGFYDMLLGSCFFFVGDFLCFFEWCDLWVFSWDWIRIFHHDMMGNQETFTRGVHHRTLMGFFWVDHMFSNPGVSMGSPRETIIHDQWFTLW